MRRQCFGVGGFSAGAAAVDADDGLAARRGAALLGDDAHDPVVVLIADSVLKGIDERLEPVVEARPSPVGRVDLDVQDISALLKRIETMGKIDNVSASIKALLAGFESPENKARTLRRRLTQVEKRTRNREAAIEKGLNVERAVEKLNDLAGEKARLDQKIAAAKERGSLSVDVQKIAEHFMASLRQLREVLEEGSVAEVKAILRGHAARVVHCPETNRARIGILRTPT